MSSYLDVNNTWAMTMESDKFFPATVMPDEDWWRALWPDPMGVLRTLGFSENMSAVDLCCGDGHFTIPMSALLSGKVYGVDLDPAMLELAKRAVEKSGAPSCTFAQGDARDLKTLVPEKVDLVFIANTFHGVPEQTALAQGIAEVLKTDGRFVVVNWHVRPREETPVLGQPRGPRTEIRMSPDDVRAVVEPAGYKLSEVVELPPYHYGAVFFLKAQD